MGMRFETTRLSCGAVALLLAVATTGAAAATENSGRFSMSPSGDGFMRLDKVTGAVSLCERKDGDWACRSLPDDQKALQDRIGKLEDENRALKDENRRLEDVMGLGPDAKPPAGNGAAPGTTPAPKSGPSMPSEKDVDKAFDYVEGMLRKFKERLKKLDEDLAPGPEAPKLPGPGEPPKPDKPGGTTPL